MRAGGAKSALEFKATGSATFLLIKFSVTVFLNLTANIETQFRV